MTISFYKLSASAGAASLATLAAVTAIGGVGTSSEALLRSSFSAALSEQAPQRVAKSLPVAGSEEFWLNAMRSETSAALTKAVSIGDRIALTLDGQSHQLQVETVSEITPNITAIDTAEAASRLVLITARDTGDSSAKPLQFLMEIPVSPVPADTGRVARAL